MTCPKWEECFHEYCVRESRCTNPEYWAAYWRNQKALKPSEPDIVKDYRVRQEAKKAEKKMKKIIQRALNKKRNFHMRRCEIRQKGCHLPKVCGLLGECVLTHERTLTRPDLVQALKEANSTRSAVKVLEEIMPTLKRYNDRKNFGPEK